VKSKKAKIIFWAANLVVLIISIIVTINIFSKKDQPLDSSTSQVKGVVTERQEDISEAIKDLKTLNVLVLGYGGAGHQGGMLTDVIQLVHFDFEKSEISMISIPRDLWVVLPNGKEAKINQAFTLGDDKNELIKSGGMVAKDMASVVTGQPVDYFVAVDFVDFKRLVGEVLDGIEVEVAETLEDSWYPITGNELEPCGYTPEEIADLTNQYSGFELESKFECRYEHLYFAKGTVKMEGGDALKYVRSRHGSAGGDFSRSRRQQEVITAMKKKLLSLESFKDAPDFYKQAKHTFTSDIDLEIMKHLGPAMRGTGEFKVKTINLNTDNVFQNSKSGNGQFILIPKGGGDDWSQVHKYVEENL
jgi:polyisoprenyl-teichoic acid--peptidoglycan teichoic acid transferase